MRLYDNIESVGEGILLFLMLIGVAFVALFAWPIREIYDSWGTYDE